MEKINPTSIETVTTIGKTNNPNSIALYGEKVKNGIILIEKYGYKKPTPVKEEKTEFVLTEFKLDSENGSFTLHKRSHKRDFEFYKKHLSQIGIKVEFSDVQRNSEGLITSIKIKLIDKKNNQKIDYNGTIFENGKGITDISIGRKNGKMFLLPQ